MGETLSALRDRVKIDQDNLDKELSTQASSYLYVAELAVNAEVKCDTLKMQLDQTIAGVDETIRLDAASEDRKITEKLVEKEIERHPDVKRAKLALIKARGEKEIIRSLREAYYMRKDMLIQLAIKQRSELESMIGSVAKAA